MKIGVSDVLRKEITKNPAENVVIKGEVEFTLRDQNGNIKKHYKLRNLIVTVGKAGIASRVNGSGAEAAFTYIAIGTGTTAVVVGNTALQTEITTGGGERKSATVSRVTVNVTNDTAKLEATFDFTSSFAITESGVLNAASVGTLLARRVFSVINVVSGDALNVTWQFTIL